MDTNTARYLPELFSADDDTYALRDAKTGELVMMASGEAVYAAPLPNAQWTADFMNKGEAKKAQRESAPVQPNPVALLHVMPTPEPTPEPVVRPVEKVDYPRMAGKAIGSIGVLSGRLKSIGRWLDALESGEVSPEFAMRKLREVQSESLAYADDIYDELSAR